MKTILTILLSLCLVMAATAQTTKTNDVPSDPKGSICGGILILTCLVIGGYFVVHAMSSKPECCVGPADLVLWQDCYDNMWTPIATNHIPKLCQTNKFEVFRGRMFGQGCRYRVRVFPTVE